MYKVHSKGVAYTRIFLQVAGSMLTSTQVKGREGNFKNNLNMLFLAIRTKARTVVMNEEERLPCDSPDMCYKREGACQSSGQKIRLDGTE